MSEVPAELRYTPEHEWIRVEGDHAIIGVTDFAQDALTDVVWVELPEVGMSVGAMESCGSVESCLLYTSPSPRDQRGSRMPSSA